MKDDEKPKYQRLKDHIVQTIKAEKLKPGEKIYSENEMAERFSISRHTVRQAIGELVSEGWLYRIQGKGTYVDRIVGNNNNRIRTIGVVTTYLNDYIFPSIIRGIDSVLSVNGYNIVLSCTYNQHEKERISLQNLRSQNIDGLIVEPTKSALPNPNLDVYQKLKEDNIPVLFMHSYYNLNECSYVVEDDMHSGYIATKHLIDQGHKNIGGIFKVDDMQGHLRFSGFQKAYVENGLNFSDSRVLWFGTDDTEEKLNNGEFGKLSRFLSECSAIVCYNDMIAIKVMDAVRDRGLLIPDDISIVSFDDSQLAVASEVKLTTVAHPKEKLGEEAGKAIIELIEGVQKRNTITIQPELIVRGSTTNNCNSKKKTK